MCSTEEIIFNLGFIGSVEQPYNDDLHSSEGVEQPNEDGFDSTKKIEQPGENDLDKVEELYAIKLFAVKVK